MTRKLFPKHDKDKTGASGTSEKVVRSAGSIDWKSGEAKKFLTAGALEARVEDAILIHVSQSSGDYV